MSNALTARLSENTTLQFILVAALGFMLTSCGNVGFQGPSASVEKSSGITDGDVSYDDGESDDPDHGSCGGQPVKSIDSDARAPKCAITATAPIYKESNVAVPAGAIVKDNVTRFEGAYRSALLVANSITSIGVAASTFVANASTIGSIQGSFSRSEFVAHDIDSVEVATAANCISAQSVGFIHTSTGALALLGRNENGQKAQVKQILMAAGFALIKDYVVQDLQGAVRAKFVNSEIVNLSGAGEIILQDSVIDNLNGFAGKITCLGSSKIVNQPSACK